MPIFYFFTALAFGGLVFWGSPPAHAQSPRTHAVCRIESTDKGLAQHGYRLQVIPSPNKQKTTLVVYYPWAEPRVNPRYTICYTPQGDGTWQEARNTPIAVRVTYHTAPTRWRIVFDSTECTIYALNKNQR